MIEKGQVYSVVLYDDTVLTGHVWDRRDDVLTLTLLDTAFNCLIPWDGIKYAVQTENPELLKFGTMSAVSDE